MLQTAGHTCSVIKYLLIAIIFQLIPSAHYLYAQEKNAVIPGDFADPSIIRAGNTYYAVGTSSEWAPHFPVFRSADLVHWTQRGYVFNKAPDWAVSSFWAPEYYFYNNTYYIYYTAKRKKDGISCIGVATSKYPDRGFRDHGVIIEFGREAIDAFVFNDSGRLYITWKAYGLDKRPIEILCSRLSSDGLSISGEPFSLLRDDAGVGLEGQSILKKGDDYYLFYSSGNCCGIKCDYNVRVARSKNLHGPFEIYPANPLLQNNAAWKCPGHGTFVISPDNRYYYLYHAYNVRSNVFTGRQGLLEELVWPETKGWPAFKKNSTGIKKAQKAAGRDISDNFAGSTISPVWQWDFRNATPVTNQKKDGLHLSGTTKEDNYAGAVFTVRPYSARYNMTTSVVNHNDALKGLVIYGDVDAAAGIGAIADRVELWMVKDKKRILLGSGQIANIKKPVFLKMAVSPDFTCRGYWKQEGNWKEITQDGGAVNISFLPQWDRSPRPGLSIKASAGQEAVFSFFTLNYPD